MAAAVAAPGGGPWPSRAPAALRHGGPGRRRRAGWIRGRSCPATERRRARLAPPTCGGACGRARAAESRGGGGAGPGGGGGRRARGPSEAAGAAAAGVVREDAVPQENQKRGVQAGRGAGQVREEGDVAPAAESHAFIHSAWSNNSKTD